MGFEAGSNNLAPRPDNPRGHFENLGVVKAQERFLKAHEFTWRSIFPRSAIDWEGPVARRAVSDLRRTIRKDFPATGPIILKDPRSCLLLPLWWRVAELEGYDIIPIITLRPARETIASLMTRDRMNADEAQNLTIFYLGTLFSDLRTAAEKSRIAPDCIVVRYDLLVSDTARMLASLASHLETLRLPRLQPDEGIGFITRDLAHENGAAVTSRFAEAFDAFLDRCPREPFRLEVQRPDGFLAAVQDYAEFLARVTDFNTGLMAEIEDLRGREKTQAVARGEAEHQLSVIGQDLARARREAEERVSTLSQDLAEIRRDAEKRLSAAARDADIVRKQAVRAKQMATQELEARRHAEGELAGARERLRILEQSLGRLQQDLSATSDEAQREARSRRGLEQQVAERELELERRREDLAAAAANLDHAVRSRNDLEDRLAESARNFERFGEDLRSKSFPLFLIWRRPFRTAAQILWFGVRRAALRAAKKHDSAWGMLSRFHKRRLKYFERDVRKPSGEQGIAQRPAFLAEAPSIVDPPREQRNELPQKRGPLVVFVSHDARTGGAPTVLLSIARWFQEHTDYRVKIVLMESGERLSAFQEVAPTFVVGWMTPPTDQQPRLIKELAKFIEEEPKFIFVNSIASGHFFAINPFPAPSITFVHELAGVLSAFQRSVDLVIEKTQLILCDGPEVRRTFEREYRVPGDRLAEERAFIALPGKVPALSSADKQLARKRLGWDPDCKLVMACGVIHWRKSPEVFVRMAAHFRRQGRRGVRLLWVGGGPDMEAAMALAGELGVGDMVEFLGPRDDFQELVGAADLFALTSVEDPFPLVCLQAGAASTPSVVFREAGGMHAFVEPPEAEKAGTVVRLGDEAAYFAAVERLLDDDALRTAYGATARRRVLEEYEADTACMRILELVRKVACVPPRVSIVLPNYNYARYLDQRLGSIASQTFKDVEILLLDDCSTDESRDILIEFARVHPLARTLFASQNGGSPFLAWDAGIAASRGDFVWIAEADDWCEPDFLRRLLPAFDEQGTRLAHGRSIPVNADGEIVGDYGALYLDRIAPGRWSHSFSVPAKVEVDAALGRANTIPNASAVVVRRRAAEQAVRVAKSFRLAGDWAFYVAAASGGRISFVHEAVNYHRRHASTVTRSLEGQARYFSELSDVNALVKELYGAHEERDQAFATFLRAEATRFDYREAIPSGRVPHGWVAPPPAVLYGIGDLASGGAQMFGIRFANAWAARGGAVVLFHTGYAVDNPVVRTMLDRSIPLVSPEEFSSQGLADLMGEWNIDAVLTGHWWADRAVGQKLATMRERPPWIIVMHGCYESVLESRDGFEDREEAFERAERLCDCWVWTAEKNLRLFEAGRVRPKRTENIVNGFVPVDTSPILRAALGIPTEGTLFMLASRAIEEKGWRVAIDALSKVRSRLTGPNAPHLLLIGDGEVFEELSARKSLPDGVHLAGFTDRLADYIATADVGLLPSWFSGESMPLVIIEFLAQGKPAIVSDAGMCAWMVTDGTRGQPAGLVVPRSEKSGRVEVAELAAAMETLASSEALRGEMAQSARVAFEKFDMKWMLDRYEAVLRDVLKQRSGSAMPENLALTAFAEPRNQRRRVSGR
jgi:glycosyltransferase involved in cell wall biosynthesis